MFLEGCKVIDLTQLLSPNIATWSGSCGFCQEIETDYDQTGFRTYKMHMDAGIGTHMDAPAHQFREGMSIDEIPLLQCIAPACLLDVSKKAHADYEISLKDVEEYESHYGPIAAGSLIIGYTGWSRYFSDPYAYRNADAKGKMHFPAFSIHAVEFLTKREIVGVAIDTLSPDCSDQSFPVHRCILGSGKYIIENVADCSQMPPKGSYVICLPLKCHAGTESPIRLVGLI